METYLDLAFLIHLIISFSSLKFIKIIAGYKIKKSKIILFIISSLSLYIVFVFFRFLSLIYVILFYLLAFILMYRRYFIKPMLLYLFSYYSLVSLMTFMSNHLYFYKGILHVYSPNAFLYSLVAPFSLIIIAFTSKMIISLFNLKKYKFNVKLELENKVYNASAYFDSGNTAKIKDLPVVFLSQDFKKVHHKILKDKVRIVGISGSQSNYYAKGKILFNRRENDVYYVFSDKPYFNGCECLLNAYLHN